MAAIQIERGSVEACKFDNGGVWMSLRVWLDRPAWWRTPRFIVRASPTCTLWRVSIYGDFVEFRFFPRWRITAQRLCEEECLA